MRRLLVRSVVFAALLALPVSADAQTAPTRVPAQMTPQHDAAIREGVDLHDKGQFDQAIAKYQAVLAEQPANVVALFELAYSYFAKRDFDRTIETARKGVEFKSDLLPLFYDVIASALDSSGQPQQAIDTYRQGIALAPDTAVLYHNMAVTYRESLHNDDEARGALKMAASLAPLNADVQLLLGQVFQTGGYGTPAILALSTFLIIEPAGSQALKGYGLWRALLKGSLDPLPDGSAPPGAPMRGTTPGAARTDEGDFSATDRQIATTYKAMMARMDEGTSEIAALVSQVDALLATLPAETSGAPPSFAQRHYVPFFAALRRNNHVEPFVYWASQRAPVPGVREWIAANEQRVRQFLDWASSYSWPQP
jgi:tetratricopeptide (TPR) repeat protein